MTHLKKGEKEGLLHGAPLNFPPLEIEEFIPQPSTQYITLARQDKCAAGSTLPQSVQRNYTPVL